MHLAADMEFEYWTDDLAVESCVDKLLIAHKYGLSELSKKSLKFICKHLHAVPIDHILQMGYEHFNELLRYEQFKTTENDIFDILIKWVEHDETQRAKCVPQLAQSIQLEHISDEVISILLHKQLNTLCSPKIITNSSHELIGFSFKFELFLKPKNPK